MYLRIDENGNAVVQRAEPSDEALKQVEEGTLQIFKAENIRGEIMFRKAVVSLSEGEGDEEEDELDLDWELITP